MEPDHVQYDLTFDAFTQIDNRNLTALTLFAGSTGANYSGQLADSFTLSRNGFTIEAFGEDFVYSGGVPTGGAVTEMSVAVGNAVAYRWQDIDGAMAEYPVSIFFSTDPLAIANALFAGNDAIDGWLQNDVLYGFAGDDLLGGSNGEDRLYGEDGNDQLNGGRDDDRLYGGDGDDWLSGGSGNNVLNGGAGSDTADYFRESSPIVVKLRNDKTAKAKVGFDQLDKLKGVENVLGGLGIDKLTGDAGNNAFDGDAGNDVLKGKGGDDTLSGDYGYDTLTGGKGNDIFEFDKLPALGGGVINIDTITDFGVGDDTIHLAQYVFGNLPVGTLSAANFRAAPGALSGLDGQQNIIYNTSNGALFYDSSGDGSSMVFQFATLKGAPPITAADFFVFPEPDFI